MRSELLEELKELTYFFSTRTRVSSSEGIKESQDKVREFIKRKLKLPFIEESFEVDKNIPIEASIKLNGTQVKGYPFVGSLWGDREAEVVREDEDVNGKIALVEVGGEREGEKVKKLKERGAVGAIFYLEELESPYIGNVSDEPYMALSVDRETAKALLGKKVRIESKVRKLRVKGKNIYFDIGKGPFLYIMAHLDSKPFVYGALDNAVAVAFLLILAKELRDSYYFPFRLRFLVTDGEELGLEGAKHHVKNLKHTYYAINIDSIGWLNPAVIYKDSEGFNGEKIMEKFYKHLRDLKIDIPFREGKRGRSDHIPFKQKGVETLFLSSNPFTFRHTFYDNYEAIDWDVMDMWFDVLSSFLRRFHKL
ncbi:PA domain-containing protein [Hydrogenivirga caldilitoris]|uniref:PA domain-containing protein n=1 Tax=Hydrogenivirga caldilitoris TaxID=246264 RepID=A0A497XQ70_9AQUI|nr:M28 family peptidase [Hydrogenivirga caldilitoris]RLJ71048.1 PA domain-containing protein [Hydrogenivirga caldilitoris]